MPGSWSAARKSAQSARALELGPIPFVHGWKVGDMLFIGGQRSLDANGKVLGLGDIEIQTEEAFRNLDTMLRAGGGDRNNLMRQNTYFRFFGEGREVTEYWEKMTNVRRRYMSVPSAAGAGLRIQGMANVDELIQVEGIGVLGEEKQRLQPDNHWDWSIPNTQFTQGWKIGTWPSSAARSRPTTRRRRSERHGDPDPQRLPVHPPHAGRRRPRRERRRQALYLLSCRAATGPRSRRPRRRSPRAARVLPGPGPAVTAIRVAGFAFENC